MNPGVLQSMGSQRVRHDLATEQQRQSTEAWHCFLKSLAGSMKAALQTNHSSFKVLDIP